MIKYYYIVALFLFIFSAHVTLYGQHRAPKGQILKYDPSFDGIGPRVYTLPSPRTLQEVLIAKFDSLVSFDEAIHQAREIQMILGQFKETAEKITTAKTSKLESIDKRLSTDKLQTIPYELLNEQAKIAIEELNFLTAQNLLKLADSASSIGNNQQDNANIRANLATAYTLTRNFEKAHYYEETYLNYSRQSRKVINQAESKVRSAKIYALEKKYDIAESIIIRTAIPLFNKSKNHLGKINAWLVLAEIYQNQGKHTEAQWFLIQARAIARSKKLDKELSEIEYMLGYSKFKQQNYTIARKELSNAYKLASDQNNDMLKLAVIARLGYIHAVDNDLSKANDLLNEFKSLQSELLKLR